MTHQDWFSPGEIRFKVREALWLIQNLVTLQSGQWPPDASNYVDIGGIMGRGHKAFFITPAEYYAEITDRMERCGQDGLILEALESWGKTEESMAKYLTIPIWSVRERRKSALRYVASGPARRWHNTKKRKAKSYQDFKRWKRKR